MDLTGKTDKSGKQHPVLGLVKHQSRACLTLQALRDKTSITPLRCLLDLIERYNAKPKFLRTDNEAVFTSYLFRFGMWLLGIRLKIIVKLTTNLFYRSDRTSYVLPPIPWFLKIMNCHPMRT